MKPIVMMAVVAACLTSTLVNAADKLAIGYVDVRAVLVESKAGKQHKNEIEKLIKDKQAELKKEEDKLKAMQEKLEKDMLTLTDAQKQEKQRSFQEKVQTFQKRAQDAERDLRQQDAEYTNKSLEEIRKIISEVAKEEKLNMVLAKTEVSVLYADERMDMTAKVIQKFDSRGSKQ